MPATLKRPGRTPRSPEERAKKRTFCMSDRDYGRLELAAKKFAVQEVSPLIRWVLLQWLNQWERDHQRQ